MANIYTRGTENDLDVSLPKMELFTNHFKLKRKKIDGGHQISVSIIDPLINVYFGQ